MSKKKHLNQILEEEIEEGDLINEDIGYYEMLYIDAFEVNDLDDFDTLNSSND